MSFIPLVTGVAAGYVVYTALTYVKKPRETENDVANLFYSDNNNLATELDLLLKGPGITQVRYNQVFPGQYEIDIGSGQVYQIQEDVLKMLQASKNIALQLMPGPMKKS